MLAAAEGGRAGGAPGSIGPGFDVAERSGCLAGVGALVAADPGGQEASATTEEESVARREPEEDLRHLELELGEAALLVHVRSS